MNKRIAAAVVVLAILIGIGFLIHRPNRPESDPVVNGCGVERWAVKVMRDPNAGLVNLTPVETDVAALSAFPPAPKGQVQRLPDEMQVVHIDAHLSVAKLEADGDYHLVLDWGGKTMIAEAPDPKCAQGSVVFKEIQDVRQEIADTCPGLNAKAFVACDHNVWIKGPAFMDFIHGQAGVASNGVEIHPITDFYVTK